ncbi:hypothetical protein ColKHC_05280 [Colletotrichum higginsianum]|nr:hypothetical protein ColKHC_05280 [Colletotrichum higginsianum]
MIRKRTSMKGKPLLILAAVAGIATAQVKLSSFTVSGSIYIGCAVINNVATETFDFPLRYYEYQLLNRRPPAADTTIRHLYFDLYDVNFFIRYFDIGVASLEPIGVPKKQYRGRTALFKRVQLGLSRSSDDLAPFDFHLHHHHRRRHHYIQLGHHTGY